MLHANDVPLARCQCAAGLRNANFAWAQNFGHKSVRGTSGQMRGTNTNDLSPDGDYCGESNLAGMNELHDYCSLWYVCECLRFVWFVLFQTEDWGLVLNAQCIFFSAKVYDVNSVPDFWSWLRFLARKACRLFISVFSRPQVQSWQVCT